MSLRAAMNVQVATQQQYTDSIDSAVANDHTGSGPPEFAQVTGTPDNVKTGNVASSPVRATANTPSPAKRPMRLPAGMAGGF